MARLPTVGADDGNWGSVLNEFLDTEHKSDGTHNMASSGLVTENVSTVVASGSTLTLVSPTTATLHDVILTDNCTITLPATTAGQAFTLVLKQDDTGGRTVAWNSAVWSRGITPTLTSTANAIDVFVFICIDGSNWIGFVSGVNIS